MASMITNKSSLPSFDTISWKYDVFLSFRGKDTRNSFVSHLYDALCKKGINVFMDDDIRRGENIFSILDKVIEESRISIIVLSKNYATSLSCLDEMVKILECGKSKQQTVWPIFYDVSPSEVRSETGIFEEALAKHEEKSSIGKDRVQRWKAALNEIVTFSGWHLENNRSESKFIQDVVQEASNKLNRTCLYIAKYPVGLESCIQDLYMLLDMRSDDVRTIGIFGIGGIGKTTIAKAVYNLIADQFESCSFLANIRENSKQKSGLVELQEALLSEILGHDGMKLGSIHKGINVIRNRLQNKRVLLVLDDVDQLEQLEALAGEQDWFGSGSRILFTTRDDHLLVSHGVRYRYKVKKLSSENSLKLFSWYAFRNPCPQKDYYEFVSSVLNYANGLPLALMVLGSFLCGRSISEWKSALDKLRRIPDKRIYEVLKISFDGLEDNEQSIFLDIACFFKGENKDYVTKVLDGCDFYAGNGIRVLIDKCLITIEFNKLWMHDLLQEMGREIVRQESPRFPGQRSRLCFEEDVSHVLSENMGTNNIEGIKLDLPEENEVCISAEAFAEMKRLRILVIHNAHVSGKLEYLPNELRLLKWCGYPFMCLPSSFHPKKLVALIMSHSRIGYLWKDFKVLNNLKFVDLSFCEYLIEIPDFSSIPNVETLNLNHCTSLVEVHESVGSLHKLSTLSLLSCPNLQRLPHSIKLKSLQNLFLADCPKLETFPNILEKMEVIESIHLQQAAIKELPLSIDNFIGIQVLDLGLCKNLEVLPCSIHKLQHLQILNLTGCSKLIEIPKLPSNLLCLFADDCKSLEKISLWSEWIMFHVENSFKFLMLSFINCQKFVENQSNDVAKFLASEGSYASNIDIKLPGSEIPEWFDYHSKESSIPLQIGSSLYGKSATWFFYAVLGLKKDNEASGDFSCQVVFSINNQRTLVVARAFSSLESDHIWIMSINSGPMTWILNGNPWISFDVIFSISEGSRKVGKTKVILKKCGFHAKYNKQNRNLHDSTLIRKYAKKRPGSQCLIFVDPSDELCMVRCFVTLSHGSSLVTIRCFILITIVIIKHRCSDYDRRVSLNNFYS